MKNELFEQAALVHKANEKWWIDLKTGEFNHDRNLGEMCMLTISELSEAMEGVRKSLPDDHLPQYPMAAVELVDATIRLLDLAGYHQKMMSESSFIKHQLEQEKLIQHTKQEALLRVENKGEQLLILSKHVTDIFAAVKTGAKPTDDEYHMLVAIYCYRLIMLIMTLCISWYPELSFSEIYTAKMEYNLNRADHKLENRMKEGGKKW